MDGSSGSYSIGAGSLAGAAGKRKADDIINVEDAGVEEFGDASEQLEDFTSLKRFKFGVGLKGERVLYSHLKPYLK